MYFECNMYRNPVMFLGKKEGLENHNIFTVFILIDVHLKYRRAKLR